MLKRKGYFLVKWLICDMHGSIISFSLSAYNIHSQFLSMKLYFLMILGIGKYSSTFCMFNQITWKEIEFVGVILDRFYIKLQHVEKERRIARLIGMWPWRYFAWDNKNFPFAWNYTKKKLQRRKPKLLPNWFWSNLLQCRCIERW